MNPNGHSATLTDSMASSKPFNDQRTGNESFLHNLQPRALLSVSKNETLSDEKFEGHFDPFSNRQEL